MFCSQGFLITKFDLLLGLVYSKKLSSMCCGRVFGLYWTFYSPFLSKKHVLSGGGGVFYKLGHFFCLIFPFPRKIRFLFLFWILNIECLYDKQVNFPRVCSDQKQGEQRDPLEAQRSATAQQHRSEHNRAKRNAVESEAQPILPSFAHLTKFSLV